MGIRKGMEAWDAVVRRFYNILKKRARASKRAKSTERLATDTQEVKANQTIKRIIFCTEPFLEMLEAFARGMPNESVVWLSGSVKDGVGRVEKCWVCELKYSSPGDADTKKSWLVNFIEKLQTNHPDHNLIILAHTHPIGPVLSMRDKETLTGLNDWNSNIHWAMIACDIQIGCYEARQLSGVLLEVEESEGKETVV